MTEVTPVTDLDREACYRAMKTRDPRFDGRFYVAVTSTGIFCRPVCPAGPPKIENCIFVPTAAAAHQLGYRPCLRCRPEAAPGVAAWRGSANTVYRALHLIAEGALDEGDVDRLAERVGVGSRHLRRLFDRYIGASPVSVAQSHRILFAKSLIGETGMPMSEIALAAGFGSIRRFNETMQRTYGRPPRELRKAGRKGGGGASGVTLKLPFSPPYDWEAIVGFLTLRAIPGVESVEPDRYRRSFRLGAAKGVVEIRPVLAENHLRAVIDCDDTRALAAIVARLRRLFDLDADMAKIDAHLAADPLLAAHVAARPGVRVPGAWDGFELAVRAILGQQVSVVAATTFAGRMAAALGEPLAGREEGPVRLFPTPEAVAQGDLSPVGLTGARVTALKGLAKAMSEDAELLRAYETLEETVAKLTRLPGIGVWTAQYIAMRALREPDAFPASDLGLMRAMAGPEGRPSPAELQTRAEPWRPWRAYAALRLWMMG